MSLGSKIAALASPGVTAAATSRPLSGGRNVASSTQGPVEGTGFSSYIGVNDNSILRQEMEMEFGGGDQRRRDSKDYVPFVAQLAVSFQVDEIQQAGNGGAFTGFLSDVIRGIGTYEANMRAITPGTVRPGSVLNHWS